MLRDVPAVSEFIPKYECVAWTALVGPAGLPEDVQTRLADGVRKSAQSHAIRTKFEQMGNFVDPTMTMERSREWIKTEGEKFSRIISAAKITVT